MTGEQRQAQLGSRRCLDGLRGLAVLSVVGFHFGYRFVSGGFFGVDVFFVLSGFLITSILLREYTAVGYIRLGRFWRRRARRLLPAMLVCLATIMLIARWVTTPDSLRSLRPDGLGALFYVSNWVQVARGGSYFDLFTAKSPVEHFWSLAIEEQFYLTWPFLVGMVFRWSRRRQSESAKDRYGTPLFWTGVTGALLSAIDMALSYDGGQSANSLYFRTDTRLQSIFCGVALAGALVRVGKLDDPLPRRRLTIAGGASAIGLVLLMIFGLPDAVLYRGGFLVVGALTATVIAAAMLVPGAIVDTTLGRSVFRRFGHLSYGMYLWHWPLILLITPERTHLPWVLNDLLRFITTYVVAFWSFRYIENPIRRGRLGLPNGAVGRKEVFAGVGAVALVATATFATTANAALTTSERYNRDQQLLTSAGKARMGRPAKVLVLGDAFAAGLGTRWTNAAGTKAANLTVTNYGSAGCKLGSPCPDYATAWAAATASSSPDVVVLAISSWDGFTQSITQVLDPSTFVRFIAEAIRPSLTAWRKAGTAVVLVSPSPATVTDSEKVDVVRRAFDELSLGDNGVTSIYAETASCSVDTCGVAATQTPNNAGPVATTAAGLGGTELAGRLSGPVRRIYLDQADSEGRGSGVHVLIVGDSVAWSIGTGWYDGEPNAPAGAPFSVLNRGQFFCQVDNAPSRDADGNVDDAPNRCPDWKREWASYLDAFAPQIVLFPAGLWTTLNRKLDGKWLDWESPTYQSHLSGLYEEAIALLQSRGAKVVVLSLAPETNPKIPRSDRAVTNRRIAAQNEMMKGLVAKEPNRRAFIDLGGFVCPTPDCSKQFDGLNPRPDGLHYSPAGSSAVADWLEPQLRQVLGAEGDQASTTSTTAPTTG